LIGLRHRLLLIPRCPIVVVPVEEVERFEREYISLFALAKQHGRHFRKLKQELDADGVRPALDPEKVGATFYRRDEVLAVGVLRQD
jgi:hypothetical protein